MEGRRIGRLSLLCAGVLTVVAAPPVSAADPAPCRVRNVTQDTSGRSLIRMVERAQDGDRLRVRGTCAGSFVIRVDLAIRGVNEDATLVAAQRKRVIRIPPGVSAVIRDLVITGGSASHFKGSAIMNDGALRLARVTVEGNHGSHGGGAIGTAGRLTMVDSIVRRNYASHAGGLFIDGTATLIRTRVVANDASDRGRGGGIYNSGDLTLIDSVVARNKVESGGGGGIYNHGNLALIDSVVRRNLVRLAHLEPGWGSGGGIENSGTVALLGSTVKGNNSAEEGGGIWNDQATGTITLDADSSVTGNTPDDCVGTPAC